MSKKVSLFAETIVNTDASDGKIIFHDTKMTHCYFIFTFSAMYGTITHGQNIQNDQKKELFFTPRSCGVSFCPGRSPGLFNCSLPVAPLLKSAYHRRWITDHTVNRRAELALECADGLRSDVSVRGCSSPFLHCLDKCGSTRQF